MSKKTCAIYTRSASQCHGKNSQALACKKYIKSKACEGWAVSPECYDDNGYSGNTINRPAFKRLFKDVQNGGIDIIVVCSLDRISRNYLDFSDVKKKLDTYGIGLICIEDLNVPELFMGSETA